MIRSLCLFCDLVETRSFTEAGRRNYLTQSAVSHHLKALEEHLGHQLVERSRPLTLTPAGRQAYDIGRDVLRHYRRLESALQHPSEEISGILRVAAIPTAGLYELPPYVATFLKRFPRINLKISYLGPSDIYRAVLTGRVDVGLAGDPIPHPQLVTRPFHTEPLVVIASRGHPLARSGRVSLKQLDGQPFIAVLEGLPTQRTLRQVFRRGGIRVRWVATFDTVETVKRAVESGLGISIVPRVAVEHDLRSGTLAALALREGSFRQAVVLVTRRSAELPLPVQKFVETLLPKQAAG